MNRKFFAGFLILAFLGIAGGLVVFSADATDERPANVVKLLSGIQREVRKNDSWVESVIQQDYTTSVMAKLRLRSHVELRFVRSSEGAETQEMGFIGNIAAYKPKTDKLLIPLQSNEADLLDAMDHELWHVLFDSDGVMGPIFESQFRGPTTTEIGQYIHSKLNAPIFAALRKEIEEDRGVVESDSKARLIEERLGRVIKECMETVERAHEKLEDVIKEPELVAFRVGDDEKKLEDRCKELKTAFAVTAMDLQEAMARLSSSKDPRSALHQWIGKLEEHNARVPMMYEAVDKIDHVIDAYTAHVRTKKYEDLLRQLDAKIAQERNSQMKQIWIQQRKSMERIGKPAADTLRQSVKQMRKWAAGMEKKTIAMVRDTNLSVVDQTLHNPNEVMARVVDSAYSLYYGVPIQNKYPLDETDLKFLERFTYEGKPLFRKAVEKYRLGLQMISDGMKAEDGKAKLEYATEFAYKGKAYSWPESKFTITGTPPYEH